MINFAALKLAQAVIASGLLGVPATLDLPAAVEGQTGGVPGAHVRDAHPEPVGLPLDHRLHAPGLPVVKTLLLRAALPPSGVQRFHDDDVGIVHHCRIDDEPGGLGRNVLVDAVGPRPQAGTAPGIQTLCLAYPAQRLPQRVVFCRQAQEAPSDDRAVRKHHRADAGVVDAEVYRNYPLLAYRYIIELFVCRIWNVQRPDLPAPDKRRRTRLEVFAATADIIDVALAEPDLHPVPGVVAEDLDSCCIILSRQEHVPAIKHRERVSGLRDGRAPAALLGGGRKPAVEIGMIGRNKAKGLGDSAAAKVRRKLIKQGIEVVSDYRVRLGPVRKGLHHADGGIAVITRREQIPLPQHDTDKEIDGPTEDFRRVSETLRRTTDNAKTI